MKNVGDKFKFLIGLSLCFICSLLAIGSVFWMPVSVTVSNNHLSVSTYESQLSIEDFVDAVANLKKQYAADDNAIVFFDKEKDLTVDVDGNYWVTEQTFAKSTGLIIEESLTATQSLFPASAAPVFNLNDIAEEAGYDVTAGEYNMVLTRPFGTKRLLVYSATTDLDWYGAVGAVTYKNFHIHQYDTETATNDAYNYYLSRADVDSVYVDSFCWVENEVTDVAVLTEMNVTNTLTYDTWGAEVMGVPDYSQYLLDTVNTTESELPEVVVAVLDTGIDTDHPWFTERLLVDTDGKYIGYDLTGHASTTAYAFEDDHGHGTHCAGIVCDMTLPNVKILPIKFMQAANDGTGSATGETSDAITGMYYAIEKSTDYNIVAINMSFGHKNTLFNNLFSDFQSVINEAAENEIFCVVSAGNDKTNASNYSPASNTEAITVSALNADLSFASDYSNYGNCVDVSAPGTDIISAYIGGGRAYMSGTSMAAPHVAAYIALLKSDQSRAYSMNDVKQILAGGFDAFVLDLGDEGYDIYYGHGLPVLTGATPQPYTVNYYLEKIYDLGTESPHEYELKSEICYGFLGSLTDVIAKDYTGFTQFGTVEQQTILQDGQTIIDIYYTRNVYDLTINQAGKGITEIDDVSGEYLYGTAIKLSVTLDEGYKWFKWQVEECSDTNFNKNFNPNVMLQTITMPASDLELTGYAQQAVYLITVKIKGKGKVSTETVTVHYGEGMTLEFQPEDGYSLESVSCGNTELELNEISDGVFTVNLYSITENTELSAVFIKNQTLTWTDVIVWGGGSLVATILFGSSAAMLIIAFREKKSSRNKLVKVNRNVHGEEILSPENRLLAALEFVSGREVEFIDFCKVHKLDYKTKYRQAVLAFYSAIHEN